MLTATCAYGLTAHASIKAVSNACAHVTVLTNALMAFMLV